MAPVIIRPVGQDGLVQNDVDRDVVADRDVDIRAGRGTSMDVHDFRRGEVERPGLVNLRVGGGYGAPSSHMLNVVENAVCVVFCMFSFLFAI